MPFMLEDVKRGGCTPVFSHSLSMGKQLTSLPMLVLLCVLKACTGRLVCVLFFTFLCFALTLHTASPASCAQDDVMGTVCLRRLNVTCFIFVQATVTRKAVSVNASSPAERVSDSSAQQTLLSHKLFQEASESKGSDHTSIWIWRYQKSQKSREIFRVCCAAKVPAQKILPPIEWPKLFQPIYFRIRSSTS